mmetsp:Transcript_97815/g.254927  ORF Transcript_97815/g.254927 Transcript_97815/m.254927 type:complete len:257 (-) Transcript_97815:191-961(-)
MPWSAWNVAHVKAGLVLRSEKSDIDLEAVLENLGRSSCRRRRPSTRSRSPGVSGPGRGRRSAAHIQAASTSSSMPKQLDSSTNHSQCCPAERSAGSGVTRSKAAPSGWHPRTTALAGARSDEPVARWRAGCESCTWPSRRHSCAGASSRWPLLRDDSMSSARSCTNRASTRGSSSGGASGLSTAAHCSSTRKAACVATSFSESPLRRRRSLWFLGKRRRASFSSSPALGKRVASRTTIRLQRSAAAAGMISSADSV